jgi:O-succinylbenzoic acid--CoA ligase
VTVATSGSTGHPKTVALPLAAVTAAARASAARLGGTGRWLLALPTGHIAGLNAAIRSLLAGYPPATMPAGSFSPERFLATVLEAGLPRPRFVSLVPTQLVRLVRAVAAQGDASGCLRDCLTGFDAILVGGAPASPALLAQCRELGFRVVQTYGCAETCGGVIYDGLPLDGTAFRLAPLDPLGDGALRGDGAGARLARATAIANPTGVPPSGTGGRWDPGRIDLTGPTLALGYTDPSDRSPIGGFVVEDGRRWFRTSDLGWLAPSGRLALVGRTDDVIVSGAVKIAPTLVEQALRSHPAVLDAVVVGLPSVEWGTAAVALIVPDGGPPSSTDLRATVAACLGRAAAPLRVGSVTELPRLASGKVDRGAATRIAATLFA